MLCVIGPLSVWNVYFIYHNEFTACFFCFSNQVTHLPLYELTVSLANRANSFLSPCPQICSWLGRSVIPCGSHMSDEDEAETTRGQLEEWSAAQWLQQGGCLLLIKALHKQPPVSPYRLTFTMNSTTQSPATIDGNVAVSYVLVPFFLITFAGIIAAVVSGLNTWHRMIYVKLSHCVMKQSYILLT